MHQRRSYNKEGPQKMWPPRGISMGEDPKLAIYSNASQNSRLLITNSGNTSWLLTLIGLNRRGKIKKETAEGRNGQ